MDDREREIARNRELLAGGGTSGAPPEQERRSEPEPPQARSETYQENLNRLLLAEYEHMGQSFLLNEQLGERRVNALIGLSVAVAFALTVLGLIVLPVFSGKFVFLFVSGLGGVLLLGLVTLTRTVHRNIAADRYLGALTIIRRRFVDRFDHEAIRSFYFDPYKRLPRHHHERVFSLGKGGLVETVALVNSLVAGAIVTLLTIWTFLGPGAKDAPPVQIVPYMVFGLSTLSLTWAGQIRYATRRYKDAGLGRE